MQVIQGVIDGKPEVQPFAEPVGSQIKGYSKIIRTPIDLGTIVANIRNGVYNGLGGSPPPAPPILPPTNPPTASDLKIPFIEQLMKQRVGIWQL